MQRTNHYYSQTKEEDKRREKKEAVFLVLGTQRNYKDKINPLEFFCLVGVRGGRRPTRGRLGPGSNPSGAGRASSWPAEASSGLAGTPLPASVQALPTWVYCTPPLLRYQTRRGLLQPACRPSRSSAQPEVVEIHGRRRALSP
ncbi:unnamed protein product [Musa acuminata subsp. malaccensis]|uniref:(wild Malaysian banana) hypothetical protein n=1 Tax=Musa acuminata subsp. malaccensis TaxID=214687 RepID=A0A8D7FQ06_MUSAM|nr:unnamed protein product [Musa acuminata subsp. malaccensis]